MTDLLVATRNPGKLVELRRLLEAEHVAGVRVLGLADVPEFPEEPETGATFAENALAKARDATKATGLAAVRVPPSACRTSQSRAIVFSPSALRSMQARSERPTSRLISCVRPPTRPLTDSRSLRVLVADGSIAYSAVTQPRPEPVRQRGTPSLTLAAHSTRVLPTSISTEPAGHSW